MDLNGIEEVLHPTARTELPPWRDGDAWLAGGTWLFSERQPRLRRLIDLDGLAWLPLVANETGLEIAATCSIADLYSYAPPDEWPAAGLFRPCCDALLASFKIWNAATVGGNLCLAQPTGALLALCVALDGRCLVWRPDGTDRTIPAADLATGIRSNALAHGELLRAVFLPAPALRCKAEFRCASRTQLGLSLALLIGTSEAGGKEFALTVTAATRRPVRLVFAARPHPAELRAAIDRAVSPALYFDDAHGTASYRRHMTLHLAEQLRRSLTERPP